MRKVRLRPFIRSFIPWFERSNQAAKSETISASAETMGPGSTDRSSPNGCGEAGPGHSGRGRSRGAEARGAPTMPPPARRRHLSPWVSPSSPLAFPSDPRAPPVAAARRRNRRKVPTLRSPQPTPVPRRLARRRTVRTPRTRASRRVVAPPRSTNSTRPCSSARGSAARAREDATTTTHHREEEETRATAPRGTTAPCSTTRRVSTRRNPPRAGRTGAYSGTGRTRKSAPGATTRNTTLGPHP